MAIYSVVSFYLPTLFGASCRDSFGTQLLFSHLLGIIVPIDLYYFFAGVETAIQIVHGTIRPAIGVPP